MGQIYSRKAYEQPSDWYKNDSLLDKMYELLSNLTNNKVGSQFTIEKAENLGIKFKNGSITASDEIQAGAYIDLIYYLEALKFLKSNRENVFEIKGILEKVLKKPIILTQEERSFVVEYKKFRSIILTYFNIYRKYSQTSVIQDYKDEDFKPSTFALIISVLNQIGIRSIDPTNISEWVSTFERLMQPAEEITGKSSNAAETADPREKLMRNIESIVASRKDYLDNFILLVKGILQLKIKVQLLQWSDVLDKLKLQISRNLLSFDNEVLMIESISSDENNKKMLIIQNPIPELNDELKQSIRNTNDLYGAIMTIDTKAAEDFGGGFEKTEWSENEIVSFLDTLNPSSLINTKSNQESSVLILTIPMNKNILDKLILGINSWVLDASRIMSTSKIGPSGALGTIQNDQPRWPTPFPLDYRPYSYSYAVWTVKWWEWALSFDISENPITDTSGKNCGLRQGGDVWFLSGAFGGSLIRSCDIPKGKALFFPIYTELTTRRDIEDPSSELFRRSNENFESRQAHLTIDGKEIGSLHIQSQLFEIAPNENNVLGIKKGLVISNGFWVLLPPPPNGTYTIKFDWGRNNKEGEVTYNLRII